MTDQCPGALNGEHDFHEFVLPAHWRNGKKVAPARVRALCYNYGCELVVNR